jgi:hypothetical protein
VTTVSSKEFVTNENKYLGMALNDHVIIQRDDNMFMVQHYIPNDEPDVIFEPDEDFYRSISTKEVREKIVGYIRKKHSR